ncbi:hypothetical protein PFISCL1PPCAC_18623, partial [Pristionchus fissidentatus]
VAFEGLRASYHFWEGIGASSFVLSVIRDGLSLDLPDGMDPNYFTFTGNRNSAVEQAEFVAATVLEWLRSGAVVKAEPDEPLAVFPLSVVSNGEKLRLIHDLSELNEFIPKTRFKLDDLRVMWHLLPIGDEACLMARSMQLEVVRMEETSEKATSMDERERSELNYWEDRLLGRISRPLRLTEEEWSWVLETDASAVALGWILRGRETLRGSRNLDEDERAGSSTLRELLGIRFAFQCVQEMIVDSSILIRNDNQGAISIMRKGRIRGARLEELQREFAGGGLGELGELAEEALRGSLAPSTVTAYSNSDRARKELAKSLGMEEDAELSLCAFVLQKLLKGQSKASLGVAVSAFGFMTGVSPLGTRYGDVIGAALKTASRKRATVSHGKAELPHLQAILLWAGREDGSRKFGCLLRVSEASALKREEVIVTIGDENTISISVRVAKAKNDQLRSGRNTFLCLKKGSPGRVLWEEYSRDLASSPSPWFFPSLQDPARAITTDGIRTELKRICEELGLPTLTPHTFRGGGASAALESGVPLEKVQRLGRWTSAQGMTPYIRDSVESQGGTFLL